MFKVEDKYTREVIAKDFATVDLAERWCEEAAIDYDNFEIISY